MAAHAAPADSMSHDESYDHAAVRERLETLLGGKLSVSVGDQFDHIELTATPMHQTASHMLVHRTAVMFQGEPIPGHFVSVRHMVEAHGLRQTMSMTEGCETRVSYPIDIPQLFESGIRRLEQPASAAPEAPALGNAEFRRA